VGTDGIGWQTVTDTANILSFSIPPTLSETMLVLSTSDLVRTTTLSTGTEPFTTNHPNAGISNKKLLTGTSPDNIYLIAETAIYRTTDTGISWLSDDLPEKPIAAAIPKLDSSKLITGGNKYLYQIADTSSNPWGSGSLTDITNSIPPVVNHISIPEENATSWILATEYWLNKDDGTNITELAAPGYYINSILANAADSKIYMGLQTGGLQSLAFDGTGLASVTLTGGAANKNITVIANDPSNGKNMLVGTETSGLYYFNDGDVSFSSMSADPELGTQKISAAAISPAGVAYVASPTTVYLANLPLGTAFSQSTGCNVTSVTQILPVTADQLFFIANGEVYYSSSGCGAPAAYSITDSFAPSVLSLESVYNSNTSSPILYMGTDQGVFKSDNLGSNITAIDPGFIRSVYSMEIATTDGITHKVLLGTASGLYEFTDIKP
jgi:hypothetical protein